MGKLDMETPRQKSGIRLTAVFPFAFSSAAFILTLLAVLSGTQPSTFEDGDMVTVCSALPLPHPKKKLYAKLLLVKYIESWSKHYQIYPSHKHTKTKLNS
jgi:hypothetical protein